MVLDESFVGLQLNEFGAFCPKLVCSFGILSQRRAGTQAAVGVVVAGSRDLLRHRQVDARLCALLKNNKIQIKRFRYMTLDFAFLQLSKLLSQDHYLNVIIFCYFFFLVLTIFFVSFQVSSKNLILLKDNIFSLDEFHFHFQTANMLLDFIQVTTKTF